MAPALRKLADTNHHIVVKALWDYHGKVEGPIGIGNRWKILPGRVGLKQSGSSDSRSSAMTLPSKVPKQSTRRPATAPDANIGTLVSSENA
jgi:hypothetical protein